MVFKFKPMLTGPRPKGRTSPVMTTSNSEFGREMDVKISEFFEGVKRFPGGEKGNPYLLRAWA